jgi:hypothetical protein
VVVLLGGAVAAGAGEGVFIAVSARAAVAPGAGNTIEAGDSVMTSPRRRMNRLSPSLAEINPESRAKISTSLTRRTLGTGRVEVPAS